MLRSILREISITAAPADRRCCVRALGIDAMAWQVIADGERVLRKILRPRLDREHDGDDGDMWQRVLTDLQGVRHGAAEEIR